MQLLRKNGLPIRFHGHGFRGKHINGRQSSFHIPVKAGLIRIGRKSFSNESPWYSMPTESTVTLSCPACLLNVKTISFR
jgi:hypothetical protein